MSDGDGDGDGAGDDDGAPMSLSRLPDELLALVVEHAYLGTAFARRSPPVALARSHACVSALCECLARYDVALAHLLPGGRVALRRARATYARVATALTRIATPPTRDHGVAYRAWMRDGTDVYVLFDDVQEWSTRHVDGRALPALLRRQLIALVDATQHGGVARVSAHRCVLAKCGGAARARAAYAHMDTHVVCLSSAKRVSVHFVERAPSNERHVKA